MCIRDRDWTADSGYELGEKLVQDAEMTALYAANDQMAMGCLLYTSRCV